MKTSDRRRFLQAAAALGLSSPLSASLAPFQARPRFISDPFTLGVASGYPLAGGFVLWTRLAPVPEAPGGGMGPEVVPVKWEVARDEKFAHIAASGNAYAAPTEAHSVHVEVTGLDPARWYWYRFTAGEATSPIGRTKTAPAAGGRPDKLRFAFASCQHYEQGYFSAYRHLAKDDLDLVVFLGDYIYESSRARDTIRRHGTAEPHTLDDYRARYALYKVDPDLRAAHAAFPWISTWDDHEVENDYADDRSENLDPPEWFLLRRAAAYKAYYEHMPLRREMLPLGSRARIYTRSTFGNLASFHVLDERQYRSHLACPRSGRGGSNVVDPAECLELANPARTLLGIDQERWLEAGLLASRTKWTVLAQQMRLAQFDQKPGPGRQAWTDGWDGYPIARKKLVDFIADNKVANPVFIGGDVHMFFVNDIKRDFDNPASPTVASEFTGTGITSQAAFTPEMMERLLPENPHVKYADSRYRGYARVEITQSRMVTELRAMESVAKNDAACSTLATFVVEDGKAGPQRG
jgi:alkaline phosphatase D